jgi:hypothetical protein
MLPFLSPKAYAKVYPITSMLDLYTIYGVSLRGIHLPMAVLDEEVRLRLPVKSTWSSSLTSSLGAVVSYIPFSGVILPPTTTVYNGSENSGVEKGKGYWDRTIDELVEGFDGVPPIFEELREVILEECVRTEGIFRRTPGVSQVCPSRLYVGNSADG